MSFMVHGAITYSHEDYIACLMRLITQAADDRGMTIMPERSAPAYDQQRTQVINALRGHLTELGIVAARGVAKVETLIEIVRDENDSRLPPAGRTALKTLADQIEALTERVDSLERKIVAEVRRNATMRRLATIPGVGPITAATLTLIARSPAEVYLREAGGRSLRPSRKHIWARCKETSQSLP